MVRCEPSFATGGSASMASSPGVPKHNAHTRRWLWAQSTRCARPFLGSPSPSPPTTPGGKVAEPRSASTIVSNACQQATHKIPFVFRQPRPSPWPRSQRCACRQRNGSSSCRRSRTPARQAGTRVYPCRRGWHSASCTATACPSQCRHARRKSRGAAHACVEAQCRTRRRAVGGEKSCWRRWRFEPWTGGDLRKYSARVLESVPQRELARPRRVEHAEH